MFPAIEQIQDKLCVFVCTRSYQLSSLMNSFVCVCLQDPTSGAGLLLASSMAR